MSIHSTIVYQVSNIPTLQNNRFGRSARAGAFQVSVFGSLHDFGFRVHGFRLRISVFQRMVSYRERQASARLARPGAAAQRAPPAHRKEVIKRIKNKMREIRTHKDHRDYEDSKKMNLTFVVNSAFLLTK